VTVDFDPLDQFAAIESLYWPNHYMAANLLAEALWYALNYG